MRNLIVVFVVAALLSLNASAKTGTVVPTNIKNAFSQKFPSATKVNWGKENEKEWEAEFKMAGKAYSANFDNQGNWMETEYRISTKEIPAPVQKTITSDFKGYIVKVSEISETANGKVCEFDMKKGVEKKEVVIDMTGNVLKNETVKVKEPVKKATTEVKATVKKEVKVK